MEEYDHTVPLREFGTYTLKLCAERNALTVSIEEVADILAVAPAVLPRASMPAGVPAPDPIELVIPT
ncbi:hypothetical protein Ddc_17758 [Ditylenchus destructor]|nr:hypothetical protein Ddc_17758 [Ditylenchus destructor]